MHEYFLQFVWKSLLFLSEGGSTPRFFYTLHYSTFIHKGRNRNNPHLIDQIHVYTLCRIGHDSSRPPSTQSWRWPYKSLLPVPRTPDSTITICTFSALYINCDDIRVGDTCCSASTSIRIKKLSTSSIVFERSVGIKPGIFHHI